MLIFCRISKNVYILFKITLNIFGKVISRAEYRKCPQDFNKFIIILENASTPFPTVYRKSKSKRSKHIDDLKNTDNQHYLFSICGIVCKIRSLFKMNICKDTAYGRP